MNPTTWLILLITLAVLAWDLWANIGGRVPTVSHELERLSREHIVIPLFIGFLVGHVFWGLPRR